MSARDLDRLLRVLRRTPLTARQISERFNVSKPTAYARVRALIKRGDPIYERRGRRLGVPGPASVTFGVLRAIPAAALRGFAW